MSARIFIGTILVLALSAGAAGQDTPPTTLTREELPIKSSLGRLGLGLPEPTSQGKWDGTWIYISRDVRLALWMAQDEGKPIVKLRFEGTLRGTESFETDWMGKASYFVEDHPGKFAFELKETGPDLIVADWDWELDMRGSSRTEKADIEMYRAGDGRRLVMHFKDFERIVRSGGREKVQDFPQAWTFRKMSRRLVLWEELPF
jgi:hypothetical protein